MLVGCGAANFFDLSTVLILTLPNSFQIVYQLDDFPFDHCIQRFVTHLIL